MQKNEFSGITSNKPFSEDTLEIKLFSPGKTTKDNVQLRKALGQFATGVAIITAFDQKNAPVGVTINSFSSVSLDPPLVLWSMGYRGNSETAFQMNRICAINILASDQEELAQHFSRSGDKKFTGVDHHIRLDGAPMFRGCAAYIECIVQNRYPGGDHVIILGKVNQYTYTNRNPLLFHGGKYRQLKI